MLVIRKPKAGRTTFCKLLEAKADVEHIELSKKGLKILN